MNPIAVTLLTGFLGTGETILLRHILNERHNYRIVVIENELGEIPVDDQLVGDRAMWIKTLANGYICCSCSGELEDTLLNLLDNLDKDNIQFDRLIIGYTGMANPSPAIQTFFSHEILYRRYPLDDVIALVDAVHADEQMNQFTVAQSQVGYVNHTLLTKIDITGEAEKLRERLARINARASVYTVTHGDIDLDLLFNINGLVLEENVVNTESRFHFIVNKQNDISLIVVELDCPVDISKVSRVMESLLLRPAGKLLRYKGMLWIDGELNRLLFQGVQCLYSADWGRLWGDEKPHSTMVFIGTRSPEEKARAASAGSRKQSWMVVATWRPELFFVLIVQHRST